MKKFKEILVEVNKRLLAEAHFYQYSAMVQIQYNQDPKLRVGAEKLAEMLRAVPSITRVSTVSADRKQGIAVFNVRAISQKTAIDCFRAFKRNCLKQFKSTIRSVKIAINTIETKNFVK